MQISFYNIICICTVVFLYKILMTSTSALSLPPSPSSEFFLLISSLLQVGWSPSYVADDEPHPQEVGGRNIYSNEQGYWELYVILYTLVL